MLVEVVERTERSLYLVHHANLLHVHGSDLELWPPTCGPPVRVHDERGRQFRQVLVVEGLEVVLAAQQPR
jgi:hypothetical protein